MLTTRILMFLCFMLTTTLVFAQATNPSSSTQPVTSGSEATTATGQPPLRKTQTDFWDGDEPGLGALVLHPFARKSYVQRQLQPIQDRLKELDELTASAGKQTKDLDARTQQGIVLASQKVNEADQHSHDASDRAGSAQQAASHTNARLTTVEGVVNDIDSYKTINTLEIVFGPGQSSLTAESKRALDGMATPLNKQRGYVVEIRGFSAGQGQAAIAASRNMADLVARYLVLEHQIPDYRIYELALGNSPKEGRSVTGRHIRGRIEVTVMKNNLDQLTANTGAAY